MKYRLPFWPPPISKRELPILDAARGGIATDDLYSFALPLLGEIQIKADVHYHEAGSSQLGGAVEASVRQALQLPGSKL